MGAHSATKVHTLRGRRTLAIGAGVLLLAVGVGTGYEGLHAPPEHTPDVAQALVAPATQKPVGPTKASSGMRPETMAPSHLFIPSINVYTPITTTGNAGVVEEGEFLLPPASEVTRNLRGATVTSTTGALMIAGHVKWNDEKGALYNLAKTPLGARAYVTDAVGHRQGFWLQELLPVKKAALPSSVWDTTGPKRLVTITCGGDLIPKGDHWVFSSNIVGTWLPLPAGQS